MAHLGQQRESAAQVRLVSKLDVGVSNLTHRRQPLWRGNSLDEWVLECLASEVLLCFMAQEIFGKPQCRIRVVTTFDQPNAAQVDQ